MDKRFCPKKPNRKLTFEEKGNIYNFFEESLDEYSKTDTRLSKLKKSKFSRDYESDIKEIFNAFNDASNKAADIFQKNIQIKNELELYIYDINLEKEHVEKDKSIIRKQFDLLKKMQLDLDKEKKEFSSFQEEEYQSIKKFREEEIDRIQKFKSQVDQKEARFEKDKRDLEVLKRDFESDKLNFETEKMEFADKVAKFDQIVKDFNSGIARIPDEK